MWLPQVPYDYEQVVESYPNVCPVQPEHGSAFCSSHSRVVEKKGFPIGIRDFLKKCGADPERFNKEDKKKVKTVLMSLSRNEEEDSTEDAAQVQGTSHLLRNQEISTRENSEMNNPDDEGRCRKDLGEIRRLHTWSRGVEMFVGGDKSQNLDFTCIPFYFKDMLYVFIIFVLI